MVKSCKKREKHLFASSFVQKIKFQKNHTQKMRSSVVEKKTTTLNDNNKICHIKMQNMNADVGDVFYISIHSVYVDDFCVQCEYWVLFLCFWRARTHYYADKLNVQNNGRRRARYSLKSVEKCLRTRNQSVKYMTNGHQFILK